MHIVVTFRHTEPSQALKEYAEKKIGKVIKYLDEPIEASVVLAVEKIRNIAEATIISRSMKIRAKEETADMYSSLDLVADKIEKQARKYRDKFKRRKSGKGAGKQAGAGAVEALPGIAPAVELPEIIRSDNEYTKPMTIEEAAMQLGLSKREFLVFTNASNRNPCVIYKRKDGNYGLIEQPV
jgi:putative sigma-54 modulation protein